MKILFTFENPLPSREADAEVFLATARHLRPYLDHARLHVPRGQDARAEVGPDLEVIDAWAPARPAVLRHLFCGLTLVLRRQFRQADLIYTRNLWVAWMAVTFGQRVAFDHYRPWPEQIPPLQFWLYRLLCHRRFLVNICHSDYTRERYRNLGVPDWKLRCVRNGYDPAQLGASLPREDAKRAIGVAVEARTVVYTGRLNHKKGLGLAIAAARAMPEIRFILVGSYGNGPIEVEAAALPNVTIVGWQPRDALMRYVAAADVLLIPPSWEPLARFGSTVLPLKLYFYMASGRPILAGDTADIAEVLQHGRNAWLCPPDDVAALVAGLRRLMADPELAETLAATALADSQLYTWQARAERIAAILAERVAAAPRRAGGWGRTQARAWHRQSWRWLAHLLGARTVILRADPPPPRPEPIVP